MDFFFFFTTPTAERKKSERPRPFSKRPAYVSRVTELGASNSERNSCPLRPGPRTNPWLGLGSPKQLSHPPGRWALRDGIGGAAPRRTAPVDFRFVRW